MNRSIRVGINGFGRMGRMTFRAGFDSPDIEFVRINDPGGDAGTFAHLLTFDSVQGRWQHEALATDTEIVIGAKRLAFTRNRAIADTDWSDCDLVIEASGVHKSTAAVQGYLDQGVKKVLVTAPVKEPDVLNIVYGINDGLYNAERDHIVTAASCTTNCLAPVVKVIQEHLGIVRGSFTTIHSITNTQRILDAPHDDLRRARACGMNLIPTTTGSAAAIVGLFPELKGKLNGHAVRVPLANASLTDCVFEVGKDTDVAQVNQLLKKAAENELQGILGFEERLLVSSDYCGDPRSSIVDAAATMVVDARQIKLYAWYDNEWGYANRCIDIVKMINTAGL